MHLCIFLVCFGVFMGGFGILEETPPPPRKIHGINAECVNITHFSLT